MNAWEQFIYAFQKKMQTPNLYGWYHILCLCVMGLAIALILIFRKKFTEKSVKYIVLTTGILLILFEIIKQLEFSFSWNGETQTATWDYQWYAFPFQFCSTPMYLMLVAGLLSKNKLRDALYAYLGTFSLFGGFAVMLYPADVFTSTLFINVHTMFWHGSMTIIGVLLWVTGNISFKQTSFLQACYVFLAMIFLALLANYIWKWSGGLETQETFNMFYISPFYPCTLPLLSLIYPKVPYFIFLICYVLGFMLIAFLVTCIAIGLHKLHARNNKTYKKNTP